MQTIITSKNNPFIKEAVSLKDKKGRKERGLFLAEGEKMTAECLAAHRRIGRVFFAENYAGKYAERIRSLLKENGVAEDKIIRVSQAVFDCISEEKTPQGVLCEVKIPENKPKPPEGDALLLDGVADPGNLGTIIRTANAAGFNEIYLVNCADAYSPKCVRASMSGIFFTLPYSVSREEALRLLRGVPVVAADMGGQNVFSFSAPEKIALAVGNEANGLSEEVRRAAAYTVSIPMRAAQESLNAGVAAAVCMYALRRDKFV
ncbi:MAG: RNA methyltransferase [Candidatus Borkfalkiaceae bacterium]|nr:RNA methyltransferase [Clostridia bacterium]MDY6224144.1 RNA methyltransferase [Christensenellaceae bacterium]